MGQTLPPEVVFSGVGEAQMQGIEFQFRKILRNPRETLQKLRGLEEETLVTSSNPVSQVLW